MNPLMTGKTFLLTFVILAFGCSVELPEQHAEDWTRIDPPPEAPKGTECWLLRRGMTPTSSWGGPVCKFP